MDDRRHGAAQLAAKAVGLLAEVCRKGEAAGPQEFAGLIRDTAMRLAAARPSMAPVKNWSLAFARGFQELAESGAPLTELRRYGLDLGEDFAARQQNMVARQVEAARGLLENTRSLVTLSYSSTVEAILKQALPPDCRVTIAESRPLMEGRRLFGNLLAEVAELRLTTDAQLGLAVSAAEAVLVGADSVLRDLAVVNKSGTLLAALAAREYGRPFYVAADTYKINASLDSRAVELESKPGDEVWQRYADRCDNIYFDITPGLLVSGFVSEKGVFDLSGMQTHVREWEELAASLGFNV